MKKQMVCILLIFCLILNCGVITAFAQTEDDDSVTFYFHCPEGFTEDTTVRCELIPKNNILSCDFFYGELMDNGLYKFVVPDLSPYLWLCISNGVDAKSEVDPDVNRTDAFNVKENNSLQLYEIEPVCIENKIYTNFVLHRDTWRYVYGLGDWMDFDEWNRYKAYLKYSSNEQFECTTINSKYPEDYWFKYKELYTFENNVLSFGADDEKKDEITYGVYGDYIIRNNEVYSPSVSGYNVYVNESDSVVSLREAYDKNVEGIENVFSDYGLGELIGDVNKDRALTVLDATVIQRNVAQITKFSGNDEIKGTSEVDNVKLYYISDFNRDGTRDIMDATAIQKRLVSL